jgi:hypothetical protein
MGFAFVDLVIEVDDQVDIDRSGDRAALAYIHPETS